jgi:hypothetical protein
MQAVDSSAIKAMGYDRPAQSLFIAYRGKRGLYAYDKVTPEEWQALLGAESKGRFVNFHIKPRHTFTRIG